MITRNAAMRHSQFWGLKLVVLELVVTVTVTGGGVVGLGGSPPTVPGAYVGVVGNGAPGSCEIRTKGPAVHVVQ